MNKRQKQVIQQQLKAEEKVLKQLTNQYQKALNDIDRKIRILQSDELTQSRIYRIEHQNVLKKQVEAVLEKLHADEYTTIQQFLSDSYTDAFVGTAYDLFGQGVPLILPIDRNAAVKAVTTDSKISEGLYEALGVDTKKLKKSISSEITRGIASGMAHSEIAKNIARTAKAPLGRAKTIVRTEAHRIQQASKLDAQKAAVKKGANIVKQWNSTLDGDTRPSHRKLDGKFADVDGFFEMDGKKARYPGDFGDPAEDCNCRCQLLQRAKAALDEDELNTLKQRAEFFGLDKSDDLDDFKSKYLKASDQVEMAEQSKQQVKNKFGNAVIFDEKLNTEKWSESVGYINGLVDEYDTRLTAVKIGAKQAAGTVDMGGLMRLSSNSPDVAFHEFAHSITTEHLTKLGLSDDADFWKEIRKIRTKYRKDVRDDSTRWISYYADSGNDINEFMAEAFTQAKMHQIGIKLPDKYGSDYTYSDQVLEVIDKYFKKNVEKSSKNDIIKLGNVDVRKWYKDSISKIPDSIDKTLPVEDQAKQAFEARNRIRTEARKMMADEETRKKLDEERPNKTFEELIESKMKRKGMTREEAIQDILETATKSNANVDKELGLGDE